MRAQQIDGSGIRIRFAKSDGRVIGTEPEQPRERLKGELSRLVVEARQCGATWIYSANHLRLDRLLFAYLELCWNNPGAIVLVRLGHGYEALMQHAMTVADALKLPMQRRMNTPMCVIPDGTINEAVAKLEKMGHRVMLWEYDRGRVTPASTSFVSGNDSSKEAYELRGA